MLQRDYKVELENRIQFIKDILVDAHADGIVFGNSGGKDSALVGILCKLACDNVLGVIMPCQSKRNYGEDTVDALEVANQFQIETTTVDLTATKESIVSAIHKISEISPMAGNNIAPRLRMTTLYTIAQTGNALVAGTGNKSERTMGYFTKWGDGACDFNPIADLTATEIFEFLRYLNAPQSIIEKAPSAGLFDGQTDEQEMGLTYAQLDHYITTGDAQPAIKNKIDRAYKISAHKRRMPSLFGE
ncbi:MAG: NAD(+) synthase [Oscillospiraceae bacterium]